jgi:hypothetical protein
MKLTEFMRDYGVIKMPDGTTRKFNNYELSRAKEIEEMQEKGYDLKIVPCRGGTKTVWVKIK